MAGGHGEKRSRKGTEAVAALLECPTLGEAASRVGISERTLRGWMREPAFAMEYRAAQQALLDRVAARLLAGATQAVNVLVEELAGEQATSRIKAAVAVLDQLVKVRTVGDLEERLKRLEEAQP